MGAKIELGDNRSAVIQGVTTLNSSNYSIIPDRIEAVTYIIAGALAGDGLKIENLNIQVTHADGRKITKVLITRT